MRRLIILLTFASSACVSQGRQYGRDFVRFDARSDAENVAASLCHGEYELISGKKGLVPSDYRCLPSVGLPH
jgi:hypothetical protein